MTWQHRRSPEKLAETDLESFQLVPANWAWKYGQRVAIMNLCAPRWPGCVASDSSSDGLTRSMTSVKPKMGGRPNDVDSGSTGSNRSASAPHVEARSWLRFIWHRAATAARSISGLSSRQKQIRRGKPNLWARSISSDAMLAFSRKHAECALTESVYRYSRRANHTGAEWAYLRLMRTCRTLSSEREPFDAASKIAISNKRHLAASKAAWPKKSM
mmetsp:Transcript_22044/g.62667  ORF Transcript_22044/g.62667 Transcript_22044/m.62667 type:complete len:215 (-) Transcript_22044:38-682(-)